MLTSGAFDKAHSDAEPTTAVAILAGGLSRRFGRDKSRLRLGNSTLLQQIRDAAAKTGCPVRVIRRDAVPRCGPLGGILTAFKRSRAALIVFLACDMPRVSSDWILRVLREAQRRRRPVFSRVRERWGFPLALWRDDLVTVERQRRAERYSLRDLAHALPAAPVSVPRAREREFHNINTPGDWADYLEENS